MKVLISRKHTGRFIRRIIRRMLCAGVRLGLIRTWRPRLRSVSIEINSLCNRRCPFCPNHDNKRPTEHLDEQLFKKIIGDLSAMGFRGDIGFTHFNEPLLDKRLPSFIRYIRERIPKARIYLNSNGDLLTGALWKELRAAGLAYANISQYDGVIRPELRELMRSLDAKEAACLNVHAFDKSTINNRAGLLAAGKNEPLPLKKFCERPFYQICITFRGIAALCCNDYFCSVALGDLRKQTIAGIWKNPILNSYRLRLLCHDRAGLRLCEQCTIFAP